MLVSDVEILIEAFILKRSMSTGVIFNKKL